MMGLEPGGRFLGMVPRVAGTPALSLGKETKILSSVTVKPVGTVFSGLKLLTRSLLYGKLKFTKDHWFTVWTWAELAAETRQKSRRARFPSIFLQIDSSPLSYFLFIKKSSFCSL